MSHPMDDYKRLTKVHELKCWPEYFQAVMSRDKTFECRINDRDFESGDFVILHEWSPETKEYTGQQSPKFEIGYILNLNKYIGAKTGHVVFSLIE